MSQADLTRKRSCTLGMHGPWGESSAVFIRVTFTFPKSYPSAVFPEGTPLVDLERNPLISIKDRAFILRKLRAIRERKRPCLEACLRFLLFAKGDEDDTTGLALPLDSESSSDEEGEEEKRKAREFTIALLRANKNLAEPRTTQGSFGPNGRSMHLY
jgi:WD repeat-containing protein 59